MARLGSLVECDLKPGLRGTVVHVESGSGSWPRRQPTYDVLWDDKTCSRAVAHSLINGDGWRVLKVPCLTEAECNSRWYDFVIAMARDLEHRMVGHCPNRPAGVPPAVAARQVAAGGMAAFMGVHPAAEDATRQPNGRLVAKAARSRLSDKLPGVSFAVSCERRTLSVAWMDGPIPGFLHRCLDDLVDNKAVQQVRLQRGLTETLVQAAADYCLWRSFGGDGAALARASVRVTPAEYLAGGLDALRGAGGLSFQSLMRCILDRWDDARLIFVPTKATAGLVGELRAMFPDGDQAAAHQFVAFRAYVLEQRESGRHFIDSLREGARTQ
jgi:hypothetical protein